MGCDIHSLCEVKVEGKWTVVRDMFPTSEWERELYTRRGKPNPNKKTAPLDDRHYGTFAWLAGVRNYSGIEPILEPRGLPRDMSDELKGEHEGWGSDGHSGSWLSLGDLLGFDYDAVMENRRVTKGLDGGHTAEPGDGEKMTWREFLNPELFRAIETMKTLGKPGDVRIVFWFDN